MSTNKIIENKKIDNLEEINLSELHKKVKEIKTSGERVKGKMYKYPETKFKNYEEEKNWRNDKRKKLLDFAKLIVLYNGDKNAESLKNTIAQFKKFYKEFYSVNDYTLESVTQKIGITEKTMLQLNFIKGMMQIVRKSN